MRQDAHYVLMVCIQATTTTSCKHSASAEELGDVGGPDQAGRWRGPGLRGV